ncbi:B12-binding domain-containing radical SAM protein [Lederbergia citrea]|uniref:B12-binding domain-containing radical SAM protein n=1 Tax=Lederbergia citrea TaxID=2833581 RepID=A0A942Z3J6_9BACI|nr:B12-binding domain-containing radical SAM protein [Lederbergia citrea]MBS4203986.1 B12-binding domain-containing radical SAM protein [Lederbergia citrea]MBS4221430.1 B12-binding domain-containing radical SAM protein [Lederbergia citrea]
MKIIASTLNAKYIHTNLAIRYLKSYAAPDYDIELAEYTIKDPTMNIVTDLFTKKPDVIGFSCYIWNIEETIKVVENIRKILPEVKIVLGGPEVSYDVIYWLKRLPQVDCIVMGEGEETFKQLLESFSGDRKIEDVHGIGFMRDGKPVINTVRNKIDLRELPSPFRFPEDIPHLSKRVVYIETSRGCPFSCQFCLSSIEVGVRYFNRDKIKEDITYLMDHGAKTIKFVDRTFNISRSYAMEMFQFLIDEHRPGTVFQFEITGDIMRPEVIEFLNKEAPPGLFRFEIGVQSTNDLTNELVKRRQSFEKLSRTVTMVKEGGKIAQHLDLIAGLPEENYDSFRQTFNDVFALGPEELQLGFLKMLRGTGLRIQAKQYGYIYMDHSPYEILENNVLDFDDIVRIKQVEDVLEKYWNDHRMDHTVEYLTSKSFETPFDFFQEFGTYWDQQGWSRIGHQLEDLYRRLKQFLHEKQIPNSEIAEGLMKYDYLVNQRYKPRKAWWKSPLDKKERSDLYATILNDHSIIGKEFASLNLNERELYKHTLIELFPFNLAAYIETGKIIETPSYGLIYFEPTNGNSTIYSLDNKTRQTKTGV